MNWMHWGAIGGAAVVAFAASCGGDETSTGGQGAGSTTSNCPPVCPNDGGGGTGAATGTSSGPGPCVEAWSCTPWETDGMSDLGSRTCIDANDCGTTESKPSESEMLPALDENFYRCQVEPVFDRLCAQLACHGVEPDLNAGDVGRALRTYHRGRLRVTGETLQGESGCLNQPDQNSEDCIGGIECACWTKPHLPIEWQRNFDSARGLGLKPNGEPLAKPEDSDLLVQPLVGTDPPAHAGMKMWSANDLEYKTVLEWLEGKTQAQCTTTN